MTRSIALALLVLGAAGLPPGPAAPPPATLREAGESARAAWQGRDLDAFVGLTAGGRLLVTLPGGQESSPITPRQARAMLSSYVQGSQEVRTIFKAARAVDSTQGYVELTRRYRLVGLTGERESSMLLGFRRGEAGWTMTEVRIGGD